MRTLLLGLVAGGLIAAAPAAPAFGRAEPGPPLSISNPVPGVLGVVPCLLTTGSALFCVGVT
ncbi:hypothetical protein ACWEKT_32735 [Nocardia takedensis]